MRFLPSLVALILLGPASVAQDALPPCATLLSAAEIRSTCGVADALVEASASGDDRCLITAQRDGTASMLTLNVFVDRDARMAAATVEVARTLGQAAGGGGAEASGDADRVLGQVFEALGAQEVGAAPAESVSAEDAALRELPDLGDGGVRYVSGAAIGIGLVTHTVVFSDGATVVKLESGIAAGRAGVCTVDGLETLARRIAGRL